MSDHELYRRWVAGDREAGDQLVKRHWSKLFAFIERRVGLDRARDISQAMWLAAQQSRGFRGEGTFRAWMKVIAHRQIVRESCRRMIGAEHGSQTSPSRYVLRREAAGAVDELPQPQREAVRAVVLEGRKPREIAECIGVPEKTVRSRTRLGIHSLREKMA